MVKEWENIGSIIKYINAFFIVKRFLTISVSVLFITPLVIKFNDLKLIISNQFFLH